MSHEAADLDLSDYEEEDQAMKKEALKKNSKRRTFRSVAVDSETFFWSQKFYEQRLIADLSIHQ